MSKIGRNKKRCEHYRLSGNLHTNKLLKQERNEKRIAKIVARREAGKTYEYQANPYSKDSTMYVREAARRAKKNIDRRLPLQKLTSIMRKLNNQLAKEMTEKKIKKERKKTRELEMV